MSRVGATKRRSDGATKRDGPRCKLCGGRIAAWNRHGFCLRTPGCGRGYRAARRAEEYHRGRAAVPPKPATVRRRSHFESYYRRICPNLTPRRRGLAAFRLVMAHRYLCWVGVRQRALATWEAAGGFLSGTRRPAAPTRREFCRRYGATARRVGIGFSARSFGRWLRLYFMDGPAALVDYRGRRVGSRARIDPALWWKLIAGAAAGKSIAGIDRALRPLARKHGRAWPSLRLLQIRYGGVGELVRRNVALFARGA